MTNTTPSAIFTALKTTIEGLTPSGGTSVGTETAYKEIQGYEYNEEPDEQAETDRDRQFVFSGLLPQEVDIQGQTTTNVQRGSFVLGLWHQIGSYQASRDRKDKDSHQLVAQLIKVSNRPAGVLRIWALRSSSMIVNDHWFWTEIEFGILYAVSSNYGG